MGLLLLRLLWCVNRISFVWFQHKNNQFYIFFTCSIPAFLFSFLVLLRRPTDKSLKKAQFFKNENKTKVLSPPVDFSPSAETTVAAFSLHVLQ